MTKKTTTGILGLVHNGKVYMAGDTQGTSAKMEKYKEAIPKVMHLSEEIVVGSTWTWALIQELRYSFKVPKLNKTEDPYLYMFKKFAPAYEKLIEKIVKKYKIDDTDEDAMPKSAPSVVGVRDRIFKIYANGSITCDATGVSATGCAGEQLYVAAQVYKKEFPDTFSDHIQSIYDIVEKSNAGINNELDIVTTKEKSNE